MILWILGALAEPVAEEIIVYAEPLAAWDDTRWHVVSEFMTSTPMRIQAEPFGFEAHNWQTEAILHCQVTEKVARGGIAVCKVEDFVVRVSTKNRYQKPEDVVAVDGISKALAASVVETTIRLRVRGHGDASLLEAGDKQDDLRNGLLRPLIQGFLLELPRGGFQVGQDWKAVEEPLMLHPYGLYTWGHAKVLHQSKVIDGQQVIETRGDAFKTQVHSRKTGLYDMEDMLDVEKRYNTNAYREETRKPNYRETSVHLSAVAVLDADLGFVTERIWNVEGKGFHHWRNGRLRLLGADEPVQLGSSHQICRPFLACATVPPWESVDPQFRRQPTELQ